MANDHYSVLHVQPDADSVEIRAAYLALMRRYHPDQNPSQMALEKAQKVSAAYTVLSDPARRREYDATRLRGHFVPYASAVPPSRSNKGRAVSLLIAAATLGLLGYAVTRPPTGEVVPAAPEIASAEKSIVRAVPSSADDCASPIGPSAVRRALFAEASRLGSGDPAALNHAAAHAVIRFSDGNAGKGVEPGNPRCSATVSVDLPPGTVTAGGQSRILGDLQYTPAGSPGGANPRLSVAGVKVIATSLATVRREMPMSAPPVLAAMGDGRAPASIARASTPRTAPELRTPSQVPPPQRGSDAVAPALASAAPPAPLPKTAETASSKVQGALQARPPAGCKGGIGPSSARACSSANLAYLDRLSVVLYNQSFTNADAEKRSRLISTRASFLEKLKSCSTDECRKSTYLSRNVEIVSIMRGQPS
jgi:hypothetical protein